MDYRLSPAARADGHRLHVHDELGSTSTEAMALVRAGETGPLWVVAHRQTAGRGRRGAVWQSPEGNLAASLLLPLKGVAPEQAATLGFVAGLALVRALDDVCGLGPSPRTRGEVRDDLAVGATSGSAGEGTIQVEPHPTPPPHLRLPPRFGDDEVAEVLSPHAGRGDARSQDEQAEEASFFHLKWPNDVLANGKKIAGILLEAEGRGAVAVGFGVNVAAAPDGLPYAATALADLGCGASAPDLFAALSGRFVETLRIWNKGLGFAAVRRLWLARAAGLGGPVTVRAAQGRLHGLHQGIDEGGRLIILAPDGTTHTVTAGEVHFGEAATAA